MSTPTPTWYDVLGVPRNASAAEIKAAWRHATDRFEPGSGAGQFRMFNDAADVLLDPARRAEYDATLDGSAASSTATRTSDEPPPPPQPRTGPAPDSDPDDDERAEKARRREEKRRPKSEAPVSAGPVSRVQVAVAAVLVLLAIAALVVAGYFLREVRDDDALADARTTAPAAAERAAKAMLSYDYRQLPADRNRAAGFLTAKYEKEYVKTFSLLEKNKDGSPAPPSRPRPWSAPACSAPAWSTWRRTRRGCWSSSTRSPRRPTASRRSSRTGSR